MHQRIKGLIVHLGNPTHREVEARSEETGTLAGNILVSRSDDDSPALLVMNHDGTDQRLWVLPPDVEGAHEHMPFGKSGPLFRLRPQHEKIEIRVAQESPVKVQFIKGPNNVSSLVYRPKPRRPKEREATASLRAERPPEPQNAEGSTAHMPPGAVKSAGQ